MDLATLKKPEWWRELPLDEVINLIIYDRLDVERFNRFHTAHSLGMGIRTLRNWLVAMKKKGVKIPQNQDMRSYSDPNRVNKIELKRRQNRYEKAPDTVPYCRKHFYLTTTKKCPMCWGTKG